MEPEQISYSPEHLAKLIEMTEAGSITQTVAKDVFFHIFEEDIEPEQYVKQHGLGAVSDSSELEAIVKIVLEENPSTVEQYKAGKEKVMGFLIGQAMKKTKGKGNPGIISKMMKELLTN